MDTSRASTWSSSSILYSIYISSKLFFIHVSSNTCHYRFNIWCSKSGLNGKYDNLIFATGFIGNALLAIILTYIGDRLGLPLYYVAILVFGSRLFDNLSVIRRHIVTKISDKKRGK